jgi:hypothetical protein
MGMSIKYPHILKLKPKLGVFNRWFTPGPPVSTTNKTDRHDIAEILLKVALNIIKQTNKKTNQLNCYTALLITKPVIQAEVTVQ